MLNGLIGRSTMSGIVGRAAIADTWGRGAEASHVLPRSPQSGARSSAGCKALLLREVKVQIDPERPVCKCPRLPELSPDGVSVGSPQHQHAEPAGVANRCRECRTDGSAHRSLDDRHLNP